MTRFLHIVELINQLSAAVEAGDNDEADNLRVEINRKISDLNDQHEMEAFNKLLHETEHLAGMNKRLNPIIKHDEDILKLEKRIIELEGYDQTNKDSTAFVRLNLASFKKVVQIFGWSITNPYKSILASVFVVLGFIGIPVGGGVYANNYLEASFSKYQTDLELHTKNLKQEVQSSVTKTLLTSNIVNEAQERTMKVFEDRYWTGQFSRSIDNTEQAIRNMNLGYTSDIGMEPKRITEMQLVLNEYLKLLHYYSKLEKYELSRVSRQYDCSSEKFIRAQSLLTSGLLHLSEGSLSLVPNIFLSAEYHCNSDEILLMESIVWALAGVDFGELDTMRVLKVHKRIVVGEKAAPQYPKSLKYIASYSKFLFTYSTNDLHGEDCSVENGSKNRAFRCAILQFKKDIGGIEKNKIYAEGNYLKWPKLSNFYNEFGNFLGAKDGDSEPEKSMFHVNLGLVTGWPKFIKAKNQVLNALVELPSKKGIDQYMSFYDYHNLFDELYRIYFDRSEIRNLDSLSKAAIKLIGMANKNTDEFTLTPSDFSNLQYQGKKLITRMCLDQGLISQFKNIKKTYPQIAEQIVPTEMLELYNKVAASEFVFGDNFSQKCKNNWNSLASQPVVAVVKAAQKTIAM